MKSMFRIYARTTKGNDPYLYDELVALGLKPKYEELLHSFYFQANFSDIFNLSFKSFTVENTYVQLGHKFPLHSQFLQTGQAQEQMCSEYFKKINFRNYLPIQRGLIERMSMSVLIRQSSHNIPSQNALLSLLRDHLHKQIVLKEYRSMSDDRDQIENYYDIKHIVYSKWEHEDRMREQKLEMLSHQQKHLLPGQNEMRPAPQTQNTKNQDLTIQSFRQLQKISAESAHLSDIPFQPHFILYIRRNHARLLLKMNKAPMYKHGWKKNVGWAPIRESLVASILYRAGLLEKAKKQQFCLWDPFCGSGTIPLVAHSMFNSLKIRTNLSSNFTWQHWPIYRPQYLQQYQNNRIASSSPFNCKIFGSDIDMKAIGYSVTNFKQLLADQTVQPFSKVPVQHSAEHSQNKFISSKLSDQIFQLVPNQVYFGCGDFQQMGSKVLHDRNNNVTIIANIPYLGERSKDHHPLNQLVSIYRRFNKIIAENRQRIRNVFVIVNAEDTSNRSHFLRVASEQWRILTKFDNGGIEVHLLAWANNVDGWENLQPIIKQQQNLAAIKYNSQKSMELKNYRQQSHAIERRKYQLPSYLVKYRSLHGSKRILEKRKARHLRAAYSIFAKRKDKNQAYQNYARKQLALRLTMRGKTWKRKNISLIGSKLEENQPLIKRQFQLRIEEALRRSEEMKARKSKAKAHKKW